MDTDSLWFLIPAVIALGAGCWLLAHVFSALHFSEPRMFEYDDVMFWWIPERRPSWFSKPYEYGRFEYADGTPVEDARLHRAIHDAWMIHNQPRDYDD